jgi:Ca2+-binding EF-hand superfamily protein
MVTAGVVAAAGTAGAQLPSSQELRQQFRETDRNGDGKLDRAEFHGRSVELFYFLDKDRKGYLVLVDVRGLTAEDFKAANRKGDGKLTLDEFINARFRLFDLADTNGDGVLMIEEVETYVNRLR